MSLRLRLTLFIALVVATAVAAVSWVSYASTADEALGDVDRFLQERAGIGERFRGFTPEVALEFAESLPEPPPPGGPGRDFARYDAIVQVIDPAGKVIPIIGDAALPADPALLETAAEAPVIQDLDLDGVHYRMITGAGTDGYIIQVARDLTETDALLASLRLRMWLIGGAGVLLAALGAWFVARRALTPVGRLTDAAEHVAATGDLDAPIPQAGSDEVGRLAAAFNEMLEALGTSRTQQRRLVADAGHELRTPLTSLRTNLEVLARNEDLDPGQRREVMEDVADELEQLSRLVDEVVETAGESPPAEPAVAVDFGELVGEAVDRARRRTGREIRLHGEGGSARVRPRRIIRAVGNLLENAVKWSPPGEEIEVVMAPGRVEVLDRGPGIPAADHERVFDRFYRADTARSAPGSGLGLAIVAQVAREHGGTAWARSRAGGGAAVGFEVQPGGLMSHDDVPATITCVECGGTAHRMSYAPPDEGFRTGDVVAFACEDCNHRMDLVWEGLDPDDH
mgnify:CR=1 FL=1